MDQLAQAQAGLREFCNDTVTCVGDFVLCHMQGSNSYCRCVEGYGPSRTEPQSCTERIITNVEYGPDPTMIGVMIGLVLMSITLCVVMRLFAKARFAENRTIFNTANPRLMNVSLKTTSRASDGGNKNSAAASANERKRFAVDQEGGATTELTVEDPTSPV